MATAIALLAAARALPAAAEPHGYVEPCTPGFVEDGTMNCEACLPSQGDPDHCQNTLGTRGYERKCRTAGHSAPGEVWCMPKDTSLNLAQLVPLGLVLGLVSLTVAALMWLLRRRRTT